MFQRKKFMNLSIVLSVGLGGGKTTNKKKVNNCEKTIFCSRTEIRDRRRTGIRTRGRA